MTQHQLDFAEQPDQPGSQPGAPLGAGDDGGTTFAVFLSHNSKDKPAVQRLAVLLKRQGLEPWLDAWCLTSGKAWQDELAEGIQASAAFAFFVGPHGVSDWAREELDLAQNRATKDRDGFRLFPVLLPGLAEPFEPSKLPAFLSLRTWVDLREGIESTRGLQRLACAIKGIPFGSGDLI